MRSKIRLGVDDSNQQSDSLRVDGMVDSKESLKMCEEGDSLGTAGEMVKEMTHVKMSSAS